VTPAIGRFAADLRAAGVPPEECERIARLYELALTRAHAWKRLYRATFAALRRSASRETLRAPEAVDSLLLLLEDDLGQQLFGLPAVGRLRTQLGAARAFSGQYGEDSAANDDSVCRRRLARGTLFAVEGGAGA
jgi:hypothetical protein